MLRFMRNKNYNDELYFLQIGCSESRHVKRVKAVYELPEEYDRGYSYGVVSEAAIYASTPDSVSLSPCDNSNDSCEENVSGGASEAYFNGDSSSSKPL